MKLMKKNQVIISALALMIAAAGYISFTYGEDGKLLTSSGDVQDTYEISDEDLVADNEVFVDEENTADVAATVTDDQTEAVSDEAADVTAQEASLENPGETVLTGTVVDNVNFAVEMKLSREQVRSENKESLMDIVNSKNLSDAQKQAAVDKMVMLTDIAERENAAEMLLEAKGFTDVVVSICDDGADVVLDMGEVTDAKRGEVEDIVVRKGKVPAENVVINPISNTKN